MRYKGGWVAAGATRNELNQYKSSLSSGLSAKVIDYTLPSYLMDPSDEDDSNRKRADTIQTFLSAIHVAAINRDESTNSAEKPALYNNAGIRTAPINDITATIRSDGWVDRFIAPVLSAAYNLPSSAITNMRSDLVSGERSTLDIMQDTGFAFVAARRAYGISKKGVIITANGSAVVCSMTPATLTSVCETTRDAVISTLTLAFFDSLDTQWIIGSVSISFFIPHAIYIPFDGTAWLVCSNISDFGGMHW